MRHRIFIAINLPQDIKEKLVSYQFKWPDLPCRWVKKENLHLTLVFLGYLNDEEIVDVCKITQQVSAQHGTFFIKLNTITYGPLKKSPRLVWAEGEKSDELKKLQKDLETALIGRSSELAKERGRGYLPHITLGRLRQFEFRRLELEERPQINEEIDFSFEVNSIEVMESRLKRGGSEYAILESAQLKS
jgi:2'-5' RNA ligase